MPTSSPWHGKTLELTELRWYNGQPSASSPASRDRTEAEALVKAILWVDHDETEVPDEPDAWYDHQLVGLRALRDGVEVGRVARVDHLPAQDLLAITTDDREVLVPFVAAIVPNVDVKAGTVTLTPPPGLFEDLPDDAAPEPDSDDTTLAPTKTTASTRDAGGTRRRRRCRDLRSLSRARARGGLALARGEDLLFDRGHSSITCR